MTETEWLQSRDVIAMLTWLTGKASDRKLRLFGCACCRRASNLTTDRVWRRAVEASEGYADGLTTEKQLEKVRAAIVKQAARRKEQAWSSFEDCTSYFLAWAVHGAAMWGHLHSYVTNAARYTARAKDAAEGVEEGPAQCDLLRDIIGNPFRPVVIAEEWRAPDVIKLGHSIYEVRTFDRLPELAHALSSAGCDDPEILAHCRLRTAHVRGCWVVDMLLGKT